LLNKHTISFTSIAENGAVSPGHEYLGKVQGWIAVPDRWEPTCRHAAASTCSKSMSAST
jgi:hypothetical protein